MISNTNNRWPYNGDAIDLVFPYDNRIDDESWLKVYVDEALQVLNIDYTVSGVGLENGGSVVMTVAPPTGVENVVIVRETPPTQGVTLPFEGPFASFVIERQALDKLTMMIQDIHEVLERCPKFPVTSAFRDITIADPVAVELLRWNGTVDGIEGISFTGGTGVSPLVVTVTVTAGASTKVITHGLNSATAKIIGFAPTWFTGFKIVSQTVTDVTIELDNPAPVGGGTLTVEVSA